MPPGAVELGELDAARAGALLARLDLERHPLAALEAVEVGLGAAPVKEVLLPVLGGDEAKAAVGNELLDGASLHGGLLVSRTNVTLEGSRSRTGQPRRAPRTGAADTLPQESGPGDTC